MKRRCAAAVACVAGLALLPATAHAADLTIPIDTSIDSGIAAEEEAELETVATGDLEGATCEVRSVRRDDAQVATNDGNDLVVRSGQDSTTLDDVEREPGAVTEGRAITLGATVSVTLVMGEDERFAAGIDVELDCALSEETSAALEQAPPADTAETAAEPAEAAPADLPATGSDDLVGALVGLVLVVVGSALVLVARGPASLGRGPTG